MNSQYEMVSTTVLDSPVSKILVLDNSPEHSLRIKTFCAANNLVALKARKGSVMSVLRTNIDLGGILYCENYGETPEETAAIATQIHSARPELPIIIRRETQATLAGLPDDAKQIFCAAYVSSDMSALRKLVDEYIFCVIYPNALLRGISEITQSVLTSQFKSLKLTMDTPYIVHDRVIFGELFSLIALESSWCRGYLMLQTEEEPFLALVGRKRDARGASRFREVNDLVSETTNLIWGGFKNRFIDATRGSPAGQVQVPLVVNHKHRYISFGTGNPQLCFRFTLSDETTGRSSVLYERFVFNLSWSPEDFKEIARHTADLSDAGELEMF